MPNATPTTIPTIVTAPAATGTKPLFQPDADKIIKDIPVEKLRASLRSLTDGVAAAFQDLRAAGKFQLKEVTIEVEVSAEGGVSLIGTVGARGAISLTFKDPSVE